jgi:hypothetical protein
VKTSVTQLDSGFLQCPAFCHFVEIRPRRVRFATETALVERTDSARMTKSSRLAMSERSEDMTRREWLSFYNEKGIRQ